MVYGIDTDQTVLHPELATSFHYDSVFGTVLNHFVVQAVHSVPLTVYGKGGQTRGFLDIRDTLRCVELAMLNPAEPGEFRVFNQFTEQFSVLDLANRVQRVAADHGFNSSIEHIENPRVELEEHYYNANHTALSTLGLEPHLLTDETVGHMIEVAAQFRHRIDSDVLQPTVMWSQS